jgi:hypothetical protein
MLTGWVLAPRVASGAPVYTQAQLALHIGCTI